MIVLKLQPSALGALLHALLRAVEVDAAVGRADALQDRVEVAVVVRAVDALEPVLARPLLAHPRRGAQAVGPVDRRAAAERRAGLQRDVAVGRRRRAAAPVHLLVGLQLELGEVRLVEVAGRLEHDDLQPLRGERRGDHAAARARADDADVGLERLVVARGLVQLRSPWAPQAAATAGPRSRTSPSSGSCRSAGRARRRRGTA